MAKALVIKNADFSANKVTTVTFNDIACTGVEFDSSSVTLSGLGEATVGYTITPSNTTDTVTLTSSDSSVLSVSGTTITVVGIGTCTLTLSCGGYTATCAVTVDIYEDSAVIAGVVYWAEPTDSGQEYEGVRAKGGSSTSSVFLVGLPSDGHFSGLFSFIDANYEPSQVTAIKIPDNTSKIHIDAERVYGDQEYICFVDVNSSFTHDLRRYTPVISKVALTSTGSSGVRYISQDVAVPSGATGYIVILRVKDPSAIGGLTSETELKAYVKNTMNVSVHYLSE